MGPLKGIRVLDLSRLLPGPVCTHLLLRMGAIVTKVEGKGLGQADYVRDLPPVLRLKDRKHGALFEALHGGKLGLSLDLKHVEGVSVLKHIIKDYDVVVEGNRPGVMDRLGVGYEDLKKINDKIIYCSLTGYGQTGPYAQKAGHDINYMAISGLLGLTGKEKDLPPTIGFQAADCAGALQAVIGILGAIIERSTTGKGQMVDISLTESVMSLAIPSLVNALSGYTPPRGNGMLDGSLPNYRIYKTKDGHYLSVGALESHFWTKLCDAIGTPQYADEPDINEIEHLLETKTLQEWEDIFQGIDVCVEPVLKPNDIESHIQHIDRKVILADNGNEKYPRKQLILGPKLSNHKSELLSPAPRIGEHTSMLLQNSGYTLEQIESLHLKGVLFCAQLDSNVNISDSNSDLKSNIRNVKFNKMNSENLVDNKKDMDLNLDLDLELKPIPSTCTQMKPYKEHVIAGETYYYCRCGLSKKQPYCDGSHKGQGSDKGIDIDYQPIAVTPTTTGIYGFCGCRLSTRDGGARCDGTHKKYINIGIRN